VVDGFLDDRHYVSPPSEESATAPILMIDRETTMRASAKGDFKRDKLQLQGQSWVHQISRRSRYFRDPAFTDMASFEMLRAMRTGGMALATHPIGKSARWAASATVDRASADVTNSANTVTGDVTIVEGAGNLQYERATLRVDAAAGVAIPFGVGAEPWPEGKLATRWRPVFGPLEVVGTVARKGRVPSLRERFEPGGNAALGPEHATHLELRSIYDAKDKLHLETAPYLKLTDGTVRASTDPNDMGMLINLGRVKYYGIDTQARVTLPATLQAGASYNFIKTDQPATEQRLPHHRADLWLQGRPEKRLTLLVRGRYFGKAIDRMQDVPAYALVELTASAQLTRDHLGVLRVEDLLNARPETRAGYFTPGRVVTFVLQGQWQ
jgi:outer membrane cobalamin receptor